MDNITEDISIDLLDDPILAMRSDVHDKDIDELAASIKQFGLLESLVVRPVCRDRVTGEVSIHQNSECNVPAHILRYEVIAGHRRLIACRLAGKIMISCKVIVADDKDTLVMRIHENSHRENVNPVDEAIYIQRVLTEVGCSVKELSGMMNRSEKYIYDRLEILQFPDYLLEAVAEKQISLGAAIVLSRIQDEATRHNFVEIAAKDGITIERALAWVSMYNVGQISATTTGEELAALAEPEVHNEAMITCAKCSKPAKIKDMLTVWIHKFCPPEDNIV